MPSFMQERRRKNEFWFAIADITYHLVDKNGIAKSVINYCNADADSDIVSFSYVFQRNHDEITYKYSKKTAKELVSEELWLNGRLVFSFDYSKQWRFQSLERISA
mgnify:CR=1 FL=1